MHQNLSNCIKTPNLGIICIEKERRCKPKGYVIYSTETLKARSACSKVFQALKGNNFSPSIIYLAKLSFKSDGGIKVFHDKQKLKEYVTTKPPLQKILKGILYRRQKRNNNHASTGSIKPHEKNRQVLRE
jgi:hypothetical protein